MTNNFCLVDKHCTVVLQYLVDERCTIIHIKHLLRLLHTTKKQYVTVLRRWDIETFNYCKTLYFSCIL